MKSKILFVFSLLFGLMMVNAGLDKYFHYMPMPEQVGRMKDVMQAMMTIGWLIPLVGFVEIIAGVLVIFPKTRALGAIMIFPIMVGIMHINVLDAKEGIPIAAAFMVINLAMIVDNWDKYKAMIR